VKNVKGGGIHSGKIKYSLKSVGLNKLVDNRIVNSENYIISGKPYEGLDLELSKGFQYKKEQIKEQGGCPQGGCPLRAVPRGAVPLGRRFIWAASSINIIKNCRGAVPKIKHLCQEQPLKLLNLNLLNKILIFRLLYLKILNPLLRMTSMMIQEKVRVKLMTSMMI
jgi:hypothetical protein